MFSGIRGRVFPCSTRSSDENTAGFLSASSTSSRVFSRTAPSMPIAPCSTNAWLAGCGLVVSTLVPSGTKLTKSTFATGASARFGPCIQPPTDRIYGRSLTVKLSSRDDDVDPRPAARSPHRRGRPPDDTSTPRRGGLRRHHGAGDLTALRRAPARDLPPLAVAPCAPRGRRLLRSQGDQRRAHRRPARRPPPVPGCVRAQPRVARRTRRHAGTARDLPGRGAPPGRALVAPVGPPAVRGRSSPRPTTTSTPRSTPTRCST